MSKKKDRFIRSQRAGTFPPCYGECGRCPESPVCQYYGEWKADQQVKARLRELSEIDERLYGRVN